MAKGAAARAAARRQRDKWKSKRWYSIRAPRNPWSFKIIGETIAEEEEMLLGRHYEILQYELDGDFSKMNVKVQFRIYDVIGSDALTEYIGHELLKDHIRRQVRRDRGKIDDTIDLVTKDGYYIRVKPMMITRNKIKASQKQEMRSQARDLIIKFGATTTWVDIQKATLDGTLETQIREAASKIQPVRDVMIRRVQLIQSGVEVSDGPTLEEIISQEDEDKKAEAAEEKAEIVSEEGEEIDIPVDELPDSIAEAVAEAIPGGEITEAELEREDGETIYEVTVEKDGKEFEVELNLEGEVLEVEEEESGESAAETDYESMTVAELKVLLKEAGKPVSGKKAELIERLKE
ncbi:MAG: SAP domain-containing protein [Candidatus Thalassarchaeum sp.]